MLRKLSKLVGLGVSLKRLSKDEKSKRSRVFIEDLLANERGLFSKFVQYLGSKPNHSVRGALTTNQAAISVDEIKSIFHDAFFQNMRDIVDEIDNEPHCASIAQVHKALFNDGKIYVIKVQYPSIRNEIYEQLELMNLMPVAINFSPLKQWGVDIQSYQEYFKKMVDEELDYHREIENQERMYQNLQNLPSVKISKVHPIYRNEKIFVQEYLDGLETETFANQASRQQKEFATYILFESFLQQLFVHRFIQTDTNHGNFLFQVSDDDLNVCQIDFGSCEEIREDLVIALYALIDAAINNKHINLLGCFKLLGFDVDKLKHIEQQLPLVVKAFFKPLLHDFSFDLKNWNLDEELNDILGDYKWWFRTAGGVEFFAIMKAFSGLKNMFLKFEVNIFWKRLFLQNTKHLSDKLNSLQIPNIESQYSFDYLAKNLRISVIDNGREKVNLTMPATTINDLENLISYDVLQKLKDRNISITKIVSDTKKQGCIPGDLFILEDAAKSYRVWLE